MARANLWTREETILAFNLYFKIPYGTIHGGNEIFNEFVNNWVELAFEGERILSELSEWAARLLVSK